MYINIQGDIETGSNTKKVTILKYKVFWEGILFLPGFDDGEHSIKALLNGLNSDANESELINCIRALRGNWVLFIFDTMLKHWLVCSDNSHQNFLYFTEESISNSFLRLRTEVRDKTRIEEESLVSYLYSGYCYTKTLFYSTIIKLDYHNYLIMGGGKIKLKDKELPDVFSMKEGQDGFLKTLAKLYASIKKNKVCLDLTGGTDTRAIVLSLNHYGFNFDLATYGNQEFSEVKIAMKIAKGLRRQLKFSKLSEEVLVSERLKEAWLACDGLSLKLDSYLFEKWRKQFNYSLVVSGTAGELYKDGGWYRAGIRNYVFSNGHERLIRMLIDSGEMLWEGLPSEKLESILVPYYMERTRQYLEDIRVSLLKEYSKYPLLESSDRIFFDFSLNRPGGTGNSVIQRWLPLYEPDMVRIGVSQPFWRRLNHNLYRQECGKLNRKVAAIKTDRIDLTLSDRIAGGFIDLAKYLRAYVYEKSDCGIPSFKTSNENSKISSDYLMRHQDFRNAIANLKDRRILKKDVNRDFLSSSLAARIVCLHYLLEP